ncbi:FG-GAP-like repeat-containing protein [Flavobacterium anhuiense]|uniref:FG-GAP-like repeat-containing protein n=1 Tax=Flavobacterium anhuiense TaxID=459526 RepID=UPI002026E98D|nr:FG-GAP-like repeat-containing protein [Flavobacterium anhuiense]URM35534.1 FG-GAP-like repeat-containing protein [Flavobacterium anhuiense]
MKQIYLLLIFLFSTSAFSQNFADTKGELQISSSGTAVYTLPIAVPPSIKNVAPAINLVYSSGVRGGIAGQGWSINSISTISRMATRRDIDGFVDGVDFDDNDKLALDGQRLLIKSGTYWANGSTYETEYKSNTKIELKVEGTTTYFIVTSPDGSRSWYGSKGSGSLQNSVSLNSWYIVHYEDANGNFIDYNYKTVTYNSTNQLYIDAITFSGNAATGIAAQNKIAFFYSASKRVERDYIKGQAVYSTQILNSIQVYANNSLFRNYQIQHEADTGLGYERIKSIQEINGQMEASNPVSFTYAPIRTVQERTEKEYTNNLAFNETNLAGDFDGDGRLDFVANYQIYTNLFNGNAGNSPISTGLSNVKKQFSATTLSNNKLNQFQSIVEVNPGANTKEFKVYNLVNNALQFSYSKTIILDTEELHHDQDLVSMPSVTYNQGNLDYCYTPTENLQSTYLEGDFNGDGISEVLIFTKKRRWHKDQKMYQLYPGGGNAGYRCDIIIESNGEDIFLVDLNPNASTTLNTKGFSKILNNSLNNLNISTTDAIKYVADFNGDGKSDILLMQGTAYLLLGLKQLNTAPWVEFEILGRGILDKYTYTKQILFGDYNGDGKTDIMLPDSEGGEGQVKWHIYYSNGNPSGGEFFVKESYDIVEYRPDTSGSSDFKTQVHYSNYYAMDINGDGKSDLVRVWRRYFKDSWTINNHDTEWRVTGFANNIGKVGTAGFTGRI